MVSQDAQEKLAETESSLRRMQEFDVTKLPRMAELGEQLNFEAAVQPAERLIRLYKQISISVVSDLSLSYRERLKGSCNADFNRLQQFITFTVKDDPVGNRTGLLNDLEQAYQNAFDTLHPFISYSATKSADFSRLENEGRAAVQLISDNSNKLMAELVEAKREAEETLKVIQNAAREQGVAQQAGHFKELADSHDKQAAIWLRATVVFGACVMLWVFTSMFLHKWAYLAPANTYEGVQLSISKMLIFGVLSYGMYLCARNFLSNKHNAIVNRHRQTALVTYEALVKAAAVGANSDIVLTQASVCIFSPQQTGYSGDKSM